MIWIYHTPPPPQKKKKKSNYEGPCIEPKSGGSETGISIFDFGVCFGMLSENIPGGLLQVPVYLN